MRNVLQIFMAIMVAGGLFLGHPDTISGQSDGSSSDQAAFQFPTSENDATFRFTSVPDLFNWNIKYPQPGWEKAMDWFLGGMKKEGPAFMLNAGDIMDARWWSNKKQVRRKTGQYWGGFKKRFEDKNIDIFVAPGDHEYGDNGGLTKMHLTPVFAKQFARILDMPRNGPEHKKGLAYSFAHKNLAVITVDTYEAGEDRMEMTVSGKQLEWFERQLKKYQDKDFIIVQGHLPVIGPVESKNSSSDMLDGGRDSAFWQTMVEYGVDAYFCGEHHRITIKKKDGIWQIVHGALWGTQTDPNYLRGSVWPDRMKLELFKFQVEYGDGYLGDHPHRGKTNRPRDEVRIPRNVRKNGPKLVQQIGIEVTPDGNKTTLRTGPLGHLHNKIVDRYNVYSRKGWKAVASSVSRHNKKLPSKTVDGQPSTHWHSKWKNNADELPHALTIDTGTSRPMKGIVYLPRQDNSLNGTVTKYAVYVSDDPNTFGEPVKTGTFEGNKKHKAVQFDQPVNGRYIRLQALDSVKGNPYASASELYVIKP